MKITSDKESPWFSVYEFESLSDYLTWQYRFCKPQSAKSPIDGFAFRGQSLSKTYRLVPSALRMDENINALNIMRYYPTHLPNWDNVRIENVVEAEFNALLTFFKEANQQGLPLRFSKSATDNYFKLYFGKYLDSLESWYDPSVEELAALAQHHGIPTRMLDWTFDFNTALYFALEGVVKKKVSSEKLDEKYAVWGINVPYILKFYGDQVPCPIKFYMPTYFDNGNARAQSGLLAYIEISDFQNAKSAPYTEQTFDSVLLQYINDLNAHHVNITNDGCMLCKLTFPVENAVSEFEYLCKNGTNAARLFPNCDGVVKKIKEDEMIRKLLNH